MQPNESKPDNWETYDAGSYTRAPNEDDDGYDPYSDRPPIPEPLFEEDPWD